MIGYAWGNVNVCTIAIDTLPERKAQGAENSHVLHRQCCTAR